MSILSNYNLKFGVGRAGLFRSAPLVPVLIPPALFICATRIVRLEAQLLVDAESGAVTTTEVHAINVHALML